VSAIEVTRQARDELRALIESRQLPADTRQRVARSLVTLEEFPRAGKQLSASGGIAERLSALGVG